MKPVKQQLLSGEFEIQKEFGGALLKKSHAKKPRPISTKNAMHLTLRSSKARGEKSFLATRKRSVLIEAMVRANAKKFGVQIYKYANVGNHIHLLIRVTRRRGFISFLRVISGVIARIVLGVERGKVKLKNTQKFEQSRKTNLVESSHFWDQRPWTRIVAWIKDFENVKKYVHQNFNEAMGFAPYKPRRYLSTA